MLRLGIRIGSSIIDVIVRKSPYTIFFWGVGGGGGGGGGGVGGLTWWCSGERLLACQRFQVRFWVVT